MSPPLIGEEGESCQKLHHVVNACNVPPRVRDREPAASMTYHHGNSRAPGSLPGFTGQPDPKIFRVPGVSGDLYR